ncbi:MAG: tyrosine-type recombinase/integrase [Acidimicrobiales bacterium]
MRRGRGRLRSRYGRPLGFGRALFLTACAPITQVSAGVVSDIVASAAKRAGIGPIRADRLRHTVASELLRQGAGLVEIGQLLRHQDLTTTAIHYRLIS